MKLSTKSTYGLRAMVTIARSGEDGATSIMDIARREGISAAYLEQLLNKLRHEGLVESIRGPKGGYRLSRDAGSITVGDIVKRLETNVGIAHCVTDGFEKHACKRRGSCVTKVVWEKLARSINDCLESITLEDLCGAEKKRS